MGDSRQKKEYLQRTRSERGKSNIDTTTSRLAWLDRISSSTSYNLSGDINGPD